MAIFFQPVWLLLLIPLAVAWWIWPLPNIWLRILRAVTLLLIVFALAQLAISLFGYRHNLSKRPTPGGGLGRSVVAPPNWPPCAARRHCPGAFGRHALIADLKQ